MLWRTKLKDDDLKIKNFFWKLYAVFANFDFKQAKDAGKETDVIVIILNNKNIDFDQTSMSQVNSQTEIGSLPK